MNEHRNCCVALLLSAIVLVGWSFVSDRILPPANPPSTKVVGKAGRRNAAAASRSTADTPTAVRNRAVSA